MAYEVRLKPAALRDLKRLPKDARRRALEKIESLAAAPRPPGARKLLAAGDLYRVRVGDYRILYEVQDGERRVLVARVRDRKDAYRDF